jgi:hypothetical protein
MDQVGPLYSHTFTNMNEQTGQVPCVAFPAPTQRVLALIPQLPSWFYPVILTSLVPNLQRLRSRYRDKQPQPALEATVSLDDHECDRNDEGDQGCLS